MRKEGQKDVGMLSEQEKVVVSGLTEFLGKVSHIFEYVDWPCGLYIQQNGSSSIHKTEWLVGSLSISQAHGKDGIIMSDLAPFVDG